MTTNRKGFNYKVLDHLKHYNFKELKQTFETLNVFK